MTRVRLPSLPSLFLDVETDLSFFADGFNFFANQDQAAADDDDGDLPPGSDAGTPAPSAAGDSTPKPKAPRKRKVELDENGQPKAKRKRRSKAEMVRSAPFPPYF